SLLVLGSIPRMPATKMKSPARTARLQVPVGWIAPGGDSVLMAIALRNRTYGRSIPIFQFGHEARHVRILHRAREQEALHRMHAGRGDELLLLDGFDALGHDFQPQCPTDADDRMDDGRVDRQADIRDEAAIDLDLVDLEAAQRRQTRIAGS